MPDEHFTKEDVQFYKIREGHRTARFAIVGATVVVSLAVVGYFTAVIFKREPTFWTALIAIGVAFASSSVVPYGLLIRLVVKFKRYIQGIQGRINQLERGRDSDRSSSGLLTDGSLPHDE